MAYLRRVFTRGLFMKFLFVFIFCTASLVYNLTGQVLPNRFLENSAIDLKLLKINDGLNGSIKSIIGKRYSYRDRLDPNLKFSVSLIDYPKEPSVLNSLLFDTNGNLIKFESKSSFPSGNYVDYSYGYEFEYKDNLLIKSTSSNKDSLSSTTEFDYKFDSLNRVIEIRQIGNISRRILFEEIEYLDDGKKSTLYFYKENLKKILEEFIYDLDGNLLTHKQFKDEPYKNSLMEYYYNEEGLQECLINRPRIYSDFISGQYSIFKYDKDGFVKKTKYYKLLGVSNDEETTYWNGKLEYAISHPRRNKGNYTLLKQKIKTRGKPTKKNFFVLDHMNNKVVYYIKGSKLQI